MRLIIKFLGILLALIIVFGCSTHSRTKETFARQLGSYILDTNRTDLGSYKSDVNVYRNLEISFYADSTFKMNMHPPFLADSVGTWLAGDGLTYSYNQLFFRNREYVKREGVHFFPPYADGIDSLFLLNGANSMKNKPHIQKIYFKKNQN